MPEQLTPDELDLCWVALRRLARETNPDADEARAADALSRRVRAMRDAAPARRKTKFVERRVEDLVLGDEVDQGRFLQLEPGVNPRVWDVRLSDGTCYSETRGALVRVWVL